MVAASGSVEGGPGPETDPGPKRTAMVPFCYHTLPPDVWSEIAHSYNANAGWWHLTASDPGLPLVAIKNKQGYFGWCHTEAHCNALRKQIVNLVFRAFQDPSDPLYEPDLVKILKDMGVDTKDASGGKPAGGGKLPTESKPGSSGEGHAKPGTKPEVAQEKKGTGAPKAKAMSLLNKLTMLGDDDDANEVKDD